MHRLPNPRPLAKEGGGHWGHVPPTLLGARNTGGTKTSQKKYGILFINKLCLREVEEDLCKINLECDVTTGSEES